MGGSWQRVRGVFAMALLHVSFLVVEAGSGIPTLTEADFAERLRGTTSALVAFVAPWCIACRVLLTELVRVQSVLAQRSAELLVAQCDVSREARLAARYRAWRTPVVVLFPDTRVLAPGLQVTFNGQLLHGNIIAFINGARGPASRHVHSPEEVCKAVKKSGGAGTFVGFFRSSTEESLLQDVWTMDCVRRYHRAFALAHGPATETGERLWEWAGLEWDPHGSRSEEAVLFVPAGGPGCEEVPTARFTLPEGTGASVWREQVERFCAWCERQVLSPVTVFDASRAAALDGTFDWLLLLFASRGLTLDEERHQLDRLFPWERRRLERFIVAACAHDKRYRELLPVLVPWGEDDVTAFRGSFGVHQGDPTVPIARRAGEGAGRAAACDLLPGAAAADEDAATAGLGRRRRIALWAVVLFNTRTRRKYPAPGGAGWCPGDELALCHFTDAALDGRVPAHFRSQAMPPAGTRSGPPPGVAELVGSTFGHEAVEPVVAGTAEVLLLVYAPWCSHSMNFQPIWRSLAENVAGMAARGGEGGHHSLPESPLLPGESAIGKRRLSQVGRLLLAQMDGTQNEHPDLPPLARFPTVLLGVRSPPRLSDDLSKVRFPKGFPSGNASAFWGAAPSPGPAVHFLVYSGDASLAGLRAWVARHSVMMPPLTEPWGLN